MLILVELEMNLPPTKGLNTNSGLAEKFPSRSSEAIKLSRQLSEYKTMVQQVPRSEKNGVFHHRFMSARNTRKKGGKNEGRLLAKKRLVKSADVLQ
jgi:hypothetical protein